MLNRISHFGLVLALTVASLFAATACGQSGTRSAASDAEGGANNGAAQTDAAQTDVGDLQLSGPANLSGSAPAPAAEIEIPSIDDAITKGAPQTPDVDDFLAGDPPAIRDPERQSTAADRAPALPPEGNSQGTGASASDNARTAAKFSAADLQAFGQRLARVERLLEAQSAKLNEISNNDLQQIRDDIESLRQSFRTTFRAQLNGSTTPQRGKLVVENLTDFGYTMNVNGASYRIMPGRWEIPVNVGPVVTELRGFESPQTWSAENFQEVNGEQQLAIQIQ